MRVQNVKDDTNRKKCLLLGSYGRGNIGDDVFLLAALELLPESELYINSADDTLLSPEVTSKVTTIATGSFRDVIKKINVFLRIRFIVYCGGDLWVELYGDRFPRSSLYKMFAINIMARLSRKKIYYLGCGIGDLSGYSLWLARLSARLANGIVVRDQRSADLINLTHLVIASDLAVNLPYFKIKKNVKNIPRKKFIIGISLLYFVSNPERNFPRLIDGLAYFIESLPSDSFKIVLLPMLISNQTRHDDLWASKQLKRRLSDYDIEIKPSSSVKKCIDNISELDLMIGTRLHANILAVLSGIPCLGIAYRPKVSSFFENNNLGDYCISLNKLGYLEKKFRLIYENYSFTADRFLSAGKQNLLWRKVYRDFIRQIS